MIQRIAIALLVLCAIVSIGGCGEIKSASNASYTIRLAHEVAQTHPSHLAITDIFKQQVEERTNGEIAVEIYPNSAKGTMGENLIQLRNGDLEMLWASDAPVSKFVPEWNLVGLPFLFTSVEAAHEALDGDFGKELDRRLEESTQIINLGWGDVGFRNITTSSRAIKTPSDMAGLVLRTMNSTLHIEYFTALGAIPKAMSFSELYEQLQNKELDGQDNPTAMIWNNKLYEAQSYMTVTEHIWSAAPILIHSSFLDSLPGEYQQIIREAAAETVTYQRAEITKQNRELIANIAEAGIEVTVLSPEQREAFKDVAKSSVWKTATIKYGQDLVDLALKYND